MFTDMFGKERAKLGLHIHTKLSDGSKSPEEAAKIYKAAGYDMIALTDHWVYGQGGELSGLKILPGCEYHFGDTLQGDPVYHIIALGMNEDPLKYAPGLNCASEKGTPSYVKANRAIAAIKSAGGLAELPHPAWSLNDTLQISRLEGIEATEIYNTVSDWGMSNRPYSGCVIDSLAASGIIYPILAVDDTHYYDGDQCVSYVMAEVESLTSDCVLKAIREGKFYSTQGPEIHLIDEGNSQFRVKCSPASKIVFMSNRVWAPGRVVKGDNLTEAVYTAIPGENFIRAEVTDAAGKCAWTNIIRL